jgi:hypothetical protein
MVFDGQYEGLEVSIRSASTGVLLDVAPLAEAATKQQNPSPDIIIKLADAVVASVISWNITEDGAPVPATRESILDLDFTLFMAIMENWVEYSSGTKTTKAPDRSVETGIPVGDI